MDLYDATKPVGFVIDDPAGIVPVSPDAFVPRMCRCLLVPAGEPPAEEA